MKKLLLIDGSSLLHRAFYALPLLSNSKGVFTNGVYGFMMMFNRLIAEQKPDYLVVCLDKSRISFRTEIAADYKGTRKETPLELSSQFPLLKEVLAAANVSIEEMEGYEADDLLGTLANCGVEQGLTVSIVSGDKDMLQLINDYTKIIMVRKGISEIEEWDEAKVEEKYGLKPPMLIDLKGLQGDSSDNISGVPGIGEKTALKLLHSFGSIKGIYEHIDEVEGKSLHAKLSENHELALRSRQLATICTSAPLKIDWQHYTYKKPDNQALSEVYRTLQLNQLLRKLEAKAPTGETTLFVDDDAPWQVGESLTHDDKFDLIDNIEAAQSLAEQLHNAKKIALYPIWQGAAIKGDILYLGIAAGTLNTPVAVSLTALPALKIILEDSNISKITAFVKELKLLLAAHDIKLAAVSDDILLAAYLLNPSGNEPDINQLAKDYNLQLRANSTVSAAWAGRCATILEPLAEILKQQLVEVEMEKLYREIELPLSAVLAKMEITGIRVKDDALSNMSEELKNTAEGFQRQIYQIAGHEFNINSPKQLSEVLFVEMCIPPVKKTKSGFSTDSEVLEALAAEHEIAKMIIEYRLCSKLKSTYTDGLRQLINPATGKLHTTFKQTITATGRLSSVEPNLQNIPVRHELGRKIRQVFIVDRPGNLLLAADYNQIELRVLANISGDDKLTEAFKEGADIHTSTASEVMGVPFGEVTRAMRRQAKTVNFGIIYGISDYGLSRDLGISRAQAHDYIEKYFLRYSEVQQYQKQTIKLAKENGYVSTLLGRRRYLPDINNPNFNIRSFAERTAINTPIQGSAADIIKIAMINIDRELEQRGLHSKMILQVHDELIFDMVEEERQILPQLVKQLMESALAMSVPLLVDIKTGADWYNMQTLEL